MDKNDTSQARKPGPNDITDDIGNVVASSNRGAAPSDRAPKDKTPDEVATPPSGDSDPRESPGSADTGRKGRSPIQYKMYPRPGSSGRR